MSVALSQPAACRASMSVSVTSSARMVVHSFQAMLPLRAASMRTKRAHTMRRQGEVAGLILVIVGKAKGGRPIW